jgi:hypothetical protein
MRRSFKLATVFTGAAALAGGLAGGYGPTALATTTRATAVHPDIGAFQPCGANNNGVSHDVHLYYPNDDHPAECAGGAGYEPVNASIYSFCPGTNAGELFGTVDGQHDPFFFYPGSHRQPVSKYDHRAGNFHVSGISIKTWWDAATCT